MLNTLRPIDSMNRETNIDMSGPPWWVLALNLFLIDQLL